MYQSIQLKNTTTPIVRNSINCGRLRRRLALITLVLFSFLAVFPTVARADCGATGDIPFTVKTVATSIQFPVCLYVKGPWGRISNGVRLDYLKRDQPCTFYAASGYSTPYHPFGEWFVILTRARIEDFQRDFCLPYTDSVQNFYRKSFWVNGREGVNIDIHHSGGGQANLTATIDRGANKNLTKTESSLGESRNNVSAGPAAGDSDVFYFVANAGDTVRVRLEADGVRGNNGGKATLRFAGPTAREVTGTLPLELPPVQLGSTARCDIAIEQAAGQGDEQYRGGYILTVESSLGNIERLVPTDSVEF